MREINGGGGLTPAMAETIFRYFFFQIQLIKSVAVYIKYLPKGRIKDFQSFDVLIITNFEQ